MKIRLSRTVFVSVVAFLFAFLALASTTLSAAATTRSNEPDFAKIDAFVQAEMQANRIPGVSLGIIHNNQIVHLHGFGVADPTGRAVTPQTPFIIGSTSKSFTALATMQLVEAGKIELDAPVQRYLPWFHVADPSASTRITVRNLLNQTSGLPTSPSVEKELSYGKTNETLEQFVHELSSVALDRPVGSSYEYSDTNYDTLGLIVQTVSGQAYGAYIQQNVFAPLQMHHSFVSQQDATRDGLAQGYTWWFGAPFPDNEPYPRAQLPDGYLISSAEDMSHYLIAQVNDGHYGNTAVLSPNGIATLHAPAAPTGAGWEPHTAYAMGWYNGTINGVPAIYHGGDILNFHSDIFIEPQNHWGAVILMNADGIVAELAALEDIRTGMVNLLAGHEPPATGLSVSTVYLIIDGLLVLITALVLFSMLRLPRWSKRFEQRSGHRLLRVCLRLVWELALPAVLLIAPILDAYKPWRSPLQNFHDLTSWVLVILVILLITGIIRAVLTFRILRRKRAGTRIQAPSPSASLSLK
jgi:CubicO group peptidase (beta-lactamase class C family)